MDEKQFKSLDDLITKEIPNMTDKQLNTVEVWGMESSHEQDRRFPETYAQWKAEQENIKAQKKTKKKKTD